MSDIKTQPAVVAEFTVTLPDGRSFQVAYLTLQFCATIEQAKFQAERIKHDYERACVCEQAKYLRDTFDGIGWVASDGEIDLKVFAFFVRITDKVKTGWGS